MINNFVRYLVLLGAMMAVISCSGIGGEASPTRTPRAISEATQTSIVVYIPVTTTPEPATATALPTVTSAGPTRTATRPPQPTAPIVRQPTATPTNTPLPGPTNTPVAACGQVLQVLPPPLLPENPTTRNANSHGGGGTSIVFIFNPAVSFQLDPTIGYRVRIAVISRPGIGPDLYMSHNAYLEAKKANSGLVLPGSTLYFLTGGDDVDLNWTVTVVKAPGGFDDRAQQFIGPTPIECGPSTPPFLVHVAVTG